MTCWRVENLLVPFLEGELPEAERAAVEGHIEQCDACREMADAIRALPELPRILVDPAVEGRIFDRFDSALRERIQASLSEDDEDEPLRRVANGGFVAALYRGDVRVPLLLIAACLVVGLLLGGGIVLDHQRLAALEAELGERDRLISAMNLELQASRQRVELTSLSEPPDAEAPLVFMPAGVAGVTGLPPAPALPGVRSLQLGATAVPVGYRRSVGAPRVVH